MDARGKKPWYTAQSIYPQALRMTNNPFTWTNASGSTSTKITSDVVSLKFRNDTNSGVDVKDTPQYFDIFMDRGNFDTTVKNVINLTRDWDQPSVTHMLPVAPNSSLHITVNQILNKEDIQYYLDWLDYLAGVSEDDNATASGNETNNRIPTGADAFFMEELPSRFFVFVK